MGAVVQHLFHGLNIIPSSGVPMSKLFTLEQISLFHLHNFLRGLASFFNFILSLFSRLLSLVFVFVFAFAFYPVSSYNKAMEGGKKKEKFTTNKA